MAKKDHTKTPYILLVVGGIISALFNMFGLASSIVTRQLLIKIAGSTSSELNSLAQESGLTQDMLIQLTIIPNSFTINSQVGYKRKYPAKIPKYKGTRVFSSFFVSEL